ncbi:MAG TPA: gamma-glutamyltransferase [Terriglobia bacterium]|nr:gamma-glutamyltransferase [Terriglobia bacterium]
MLVSNQSIACNLALIILLHVMQAFGASPVAARHGMVVSSEPLASDAGLEILRAGGNAVDAAVATGFVLAVTYPQAGNIGGGGFMLIRMADGRSTVVDFREEAPAAATRNMYLDRTGVRAQEASTVGALAAGVPGTVAGFVLAEKNFGRLGLAQVLGPAIHLAEEGFPISDSFSRSLYDSRGLLSRFDETRRIFLCGGDGCVPGRVFRQPELARTLRQIAAAGRDGFYKGTVARAVAATMRRYGGIVKVDDLEQYRARLRRPLVGHFRGYDVLTVPSPSSGGIGLIEMLNVLEPLEIGPPHSFQSMRLIVETMRRAYADRSAYLGDADYVSVPVIGLTSPEYAARVRNEILRTATHAPVLPGTPQRYESSQTTHYSVVDAEGNAVSNTYTLNGSYGCGVTVEGAGFLLNNEMDDFTTQPGVPNMFGLVQGEANAIAPRKRPLSSMTPAIILQRGKVRWVLGSPGGGTIINTVLQVFLNMAVFKLNVQEAVTSPRFHHQWMPDELVLERGGFLPDTIQRLREAGYTIATRDKIGECEAIEIDPDTGWRFGGVDPRGDGKAAGY